ncbi:MAG: hypothetical protein K5849_02770 [Bacteroidales bacterium]|nr:hypothetical protein [Bacteroidales bacterium]
MSISLSKAQDMVSAAGEQGLEKSVRYAVSKFTDTRDRKLEDVMKKMPGFTSEWGSFSYNGIYVNKYYVNGQDILGEHYYTEFSDHAAKHLILGDFKAEYTLSPTWVMMASVTNILNQDTYNYTLVDNEDFSRSFTSFGIRPRNVLLSLYHKF